MAKKSRKKRNRPFRDQSEYMTPNQAGDSVGLTGEAVKQWIYKGKLKAIKMVNGYWRINKETFQEFMEGRAHLGGHVLVISKDKAVRSLVALVFTDSDYTNCVTDTKVDAILQAASLRPGIIIFDLDFCTDNLSLFSRIMGGRHTSGASIFFVGSSNIPEKVIGMMLEVCGKGYFDKKKLTGFRPALESVKSA